MRELTAQLSQSVAADPPPALRASVLDQIASMPQQSADPVDLPEPRGGRHASPSSAPAPEPVAPEGSNVVAMKRRSWATRASALVAAAAVLGAIAVGGWAIQGRNDARDDTAAAQQQVEQLTAVLGSADVQTASVPAATGGTATVVRSADKGVALLIASDLPDLPNDQVYEAWTFDDETPVAAGTFATNSTHQLPSAGIDTSTVAVTVEPAGGVDAPTSDPIAVIDLT